MKYNVITVSGFSHKKTLEKLTKKVSEAMELGWEPLGGMISTGTYYCQTMIKRRV